MKTVKRWAPGFVFDGKFEPDLDAICTTRQLAVERGQVGTKPVRVTITWEVPKNPRRK